MDGADGQLRGIALLEDTMQLGLFERGRGSALPIVLIGDVDRNVVLVQQRDDRG